VKENRSWHNSASVKIARRLPDQEWLKNSHEALADCPDHLFKAANTQSLTISHSSARISTVTSIFEWDLYSTPNNLALWPAPKSNIFPRQRQWFLHWNWKAIKRGRRDTPAKSPAVQVSSMLGGNKLDTWTQLHRCTTAATHRNSYACTRSITFINCSFCDKVQIELNSAIVTGRYSLCFSSAQSLNVRFHLRIC
jgi:hypothetical protein